MQISRVSGDGDSCGSPFEITLCTVGGSHCEGRLHCDFVAVCNGVFSQAHVPTIDGCERFAGRVLHSGEVTDPLALKGKRMLVGGAGKSALDCATWAAQHGNTSTLVFRAPHWIVPRYFFGQIRTDRMILTRFSERFVPYHSLSRFESFLHRPARAIVRLWILLSEYFAPLWPSRYRDVGEEHRRSRLSASPAN